MKSCKNIFINFNKYLNAVRRTNVSFSQHSYSTLNGAKCRNNNSNTGRTIKLSNYQNVKQYSSSHNHHGQSKFKDVFTYTGLGAIMFGTIVAVFNIAETKTDDLKVKVENSASRADADAHVVEQVQSEPPESQVIEQPTETDIQPVESNRELSITVEPVEIVETAAAQSDTTIVEVVAGDHTETIEVTVVDQDQVESIEIEAETPAKPLVPSMPTHAKYLIIGGGTAAMAAFKSIRANDPTAKVLVISDEAYLPYMRPPLSKDLWTTKDKDLIEKLKFKQWNDNERSVFFLDEEFYVDPEYLDHQVNGGVAVLKQKKVVEIDAKTKTVRLNDGWEVSYDKCLLATGGRPRNLPSLDKLDSPHEDKVILYRSIDDFKRLHGLLAQNNNKTICVVGGGFLGSELACALAQSNKNSNTNATVIQVFPESGNLARILPQYLSKWTTNKVRQEGVSVITDTVVTGAKYDADKLILLTKNKNNNQDKWIVADHVVVAVGLEPNTDLAKSAGLEVSKEFGGFVVNSELQARDSIWVAGDAACFYDIQLGRRRVEHHDHAIVSGRLAGENMTGAAKPYQHQSMFWSDVGSKIAFEAIGRVDSTLNTMGIFAASDQQDQHQTKSSDEPSLDDYTLVQQRDHDNVDNDKYEKGLIMYFDNEQLVGVLLWNLFQRIPIARKVLASQPHIKNYEDIAKLFKLNQVKTDAEEEK